MNSLCLLVLTLRVFASQCFMFDFMFLFGGLLIERRNIPGAWSFMYVLNPVPKGLNIAGMQEFSCSGSDCPRILVQRGDTQESMSSSDYAATFLSTSSSGDPWTTVGYLILSICVMRLLVMIAMKANTTK